jgi:hypothetical protein
VKPWETHNEQSILRIRQLKKSRWANTSIFYDTEPLDEWFNHTANNICTIYSVRLCMICAPALCTCLIKMSALHYCVGGSVSSPTYSVSWSCLQVSQKYTLPLVLCKSGQHPRALHSQLENHIVGRGCTWAPFSFIEYDAIRLRMRNNSRHECIPVICDRISSVNSHKLIWAV